MFWLRNKKIIFSYALLSGGLGFDPSLQLHPYYVNDYILHTSDKSSSSNLMINMEKAPENLGEIWRLVGYLFITVNTCAGYRHLVIFVMQSHIFELIIYEPHHNKTGPPDLQLGKDQSCLLSYRD